MLEFIKMFGLGILYTILFPFIVVFFAVVLVYVVINYLVHEVVNFFGFFLGHTFTTDTALDIKLKEIKAASHKEVELVNSQEREEEVEDASQTLFEDEKGSENNELY